MKVNCSEIKISLPIMMMGLLMITPVFVFVKATNESSYQYGEKRAGDMWSNCTTLADDRGNVPSCDYAYTACHLQAFPYTHEVMTNITACIDGYIHAWNHICVQNLIKAHKFTLDCPTTFEREMG